MTAGMSEPILISDRFRGPPGSANGGYTCGRVAAHVGNPAEVTLRDRPPLGQPLNVERHGDQVHLVHNQTLVAEGVAAEPAVQVPARVSFDAATEVSAPISPEDHPYPECFVCGPLRSPGDGLRIYPGRIEDRDVFAAPWIPDESLDRGDGVVDNVFMWAALDCPSGFATILLGPRSPIILGRLTAQIIESVAVGERLVVVGAPISRDGRKRFAGTAIFSERGDVKGLAHATWIELR